MSVHFITPSNALAPYIKRYWAIENTFDKNEKYIQRIVPTGLTELILYFTESPKILTKNKYRPSKIALYGHQNDFYDIELTGKLSVFSIVFQPQGLMCFFKFPLHEICNQNIPLQCIDRQTGRDFEEKMGVATTFQERVNIAEAYFYNLLKNNYTNSEFQRINHFVELIKKSHGNINSNKMALSRRQLERIFSKHIGISPKQYQKIIRFQFSIFQKQQNKYVGTTELTCESGYFDHTHLINDFKSLCGLKPKQYFMENEAYSDFFSKKNVHLCRPVGYIHTQIKP